MVDKQHIVAVIGGAVAGSEAVHRLAVNGIHCVVFEQNALPYGKLETGLPKWHVKLREKEEAKIDEKLDHHLVDYIPLVRLGNEIDFKQLKNEWGFSAILLATGAWKDRPLPVKGIDRYINKGLYYQNAFVNWFNYNHDPQFFEEEFSVSDDAVIIGGGLASIDVAKIVMIETVNKRLQQRGMTADLLILEKKGIPAVLQDLGVRFEELQLKGCTLYYRRRLIDMPLNSIPDKPTEREVQVAHRVRRKIMENMQSKYLFRFRECLQPGQAIIGQNRLKGIIFTPTEVHDGRLVSKEQFTVPVKTDLVISAIGSLPQEIPGIPYRNGSFELSDEESGQISGYDNVFALGNAVTGRGNIKESQMHGRLVSERVMDEYLVWNRKDYQQIFDRAIENADRKVDRIRSRLQSTPGLSADDIHKIKEKVKNLQQNIGYDGNYRSWITRHLPVRIESV
jgi:NADPH-dependent glutamate synthase beta subunit-like oxidoreductase